MARTIEGLYRQGPIRWALFQAECQTPGTDEEFKHFKTLAHEAARRASTMKGRPGHKRQAPGSVRQEGS